MYHSKAGWQLGSMQGVEWRMLELVLRTSTSRMDKGGKLERMESNTNV
jgi:hypothetical protein